MTPGTEAVLHELARARGAAISVIGNTITASIAGRAATLSLPVDSDAVDALADVPSALPSRARGDLREKALYNVVQDMVEVTDGGRLKDRELRDALPQVLHADPGSRRVLASVMSRHYWFHPRAAKAATPATFLTPFHADLPGGYDYAGRYKSFRGNLLLLLCFDGSGFDLTLAAKLLDFFRSDNGLNPLDRELLRSARDVAASRGQVRDAAAEHLLEFEPSLRERLSHGAFDLHGLKRIRADLETVMTLRLPRHDKVAALVLALSLHIALYYYRLAFTLGEGLAAAARVLDGEPPGDPPSFDGQVLFRVGSGGDRPVSHTDPCARSWWRLDEQHLLALPASMLCANLLHRATASSGATTPALPNPYDCAANLHSDPAASALAELLCGCAAACLSEIANQTPRACEPGTGGYALRAAALATFQHRGSALKQRGRDVVNSLVGGFGGGLKRNRGPVRFFELDEQVLFLLVKLVMDREGQQQLPLRTGFLPALRSYGLAPQDTAEEELLADALQRLSLLDRYSDAGEALYVRHIL